MEKVDQKFITFMEIVLDDKLQTFDLKDIFSAIKSNTTLNKGMYEQLINFVSANDPSKRFQTLNVNLNKVIGTYLEKIENLNKITDIRLEENKLLLIQQYEILIKVLQMILEHYNPNKEEKPDVIHLAS